MMRIACAGIFVVAAVLMGAPSQAQTLPPIPVPAENPITPQKQLLGKVLFWDEQLSGDDTVACGTCHSPSHAGADARVGVNPGADGIRGSDDDVLGSPGVVRSDSAGEPVEDPLFGFDVQVTARTANPVVGSAYVPEAFWDGRASGTFIDPETGVLSILEDGALESQALAPIVSTVEMGHDGRTWAEVTSKLQSVTPLRLAGDLPADLLAASLAIDADPTYPELFDAAFGDPTITAERIAWALATYERALVADQTPWDLFMAGNPAALTPPQQQGWLAFQASPCATCHAPPLFTDHSFRNVGVRPAAEDIGREEVTGNPGDRGRFKVPTLRNVGLKRNFMHNGGLTSLPDIITFYLPGNQFPGNLDPLLPVALPPPVVPAAIDFLENGLTDPRVAAELPPFDRPSIFAGRDPETLLFFAADDVTLTWPEPRNVLSYTLYRGDLADLQDSNADGLPDFGYGDCMLALDPDPTDTELVDTKLPLPGQGYFYLKALVDADGERALGTTSSGLARVVAVACP